MTSLARLFAVLFSLISMTYTFYVVGKLMIFLSLPKTVPLASKWIFSLLDNKSRLETSYGPIALDTLLLIGFIFQHSLMKSEILKKIFKIFKLEVLERSIYCMTSSLCLHYLVNNWQSAQSVILWQFNVEESALLWWTVVVIHTYAWIVIYGGSIILDLPEILGIKQTYYNAKNLGTPISYKSNQLSALYSHVRHPSFISFFVIFWITNLMSLDRLILSVLLTAYMYLAWSPDKRDYEYQKAQLNAKTRELQCIRLKRF
ncbi:nurim homolog [Teleopsis dalmanni]|uniref:nurim homolog n=1 Tax=Teleopsis dalmanni TaxID=139649 RepID=UPI0018CE246D|nr:nurim homolog [Teleopsis dalmanni]